MQITVTLSGDEWAAGVGQRGDGTSASLTSQVLGAFISAQVRSPAPSSNRPSPSLTVALSDRRPRRLHLGAVGGQRLE